MEKGMFYFIIPALGLMGFSATIVWVYVTWDSMPFPIFFGAGALIMLGIAVGAPATYWYEEHHE